jgi:hypothetical protein
MKSFWYVEQPAVPQPAPPYTWLMTMFGETAIAGWTKTPSTKPIRRAVERM